MNSEDQLLLQDILQSVHPNVVLNAKQQQQQQQTTHQVNKQLTRKPSEASINEQPQSVLLLSEKIAVLQKQKAEAILNEQYMKAGELKDKIVDLQALLDERLRADVPEQRRTAISDMQKDLQDKDKRQRVALALQKLKEQMLEKEKQHREALQKAADCSAEIDQLRQKMQTLVDFLKQS